VADGEAMKTPATSSAEDLAAGVSLDALFRSNARARPDAAALIGSKLRFSYAQADAAIERLARRLRSFGMPPESVVAVQLPNIPEAVVALLATMRAGLVPAPVPMPWRRADLVAALTAVQPKASISLARFGDERPAEVMCEAAAELFQLSFPCAFGDDVPDGVIALDRDDAQSQPGEGAPFAPSGSQVAILTFDTAANGFFPAARGHSQWLAAGLAVLLEAHIESGDTILSTLPPSSLAGIGTSLVPWLLSGGILKIVDGSSPGLYRPESRDRACHLIGPAAAVVEVASIFGDQFASCVAVHRSHRTHARDFSNIKANRLVDFFGLGEQGAAVLRRDEHSKPRQIPIGSIAAPSSGRAPVVIETNVQGDQLLLRGPMLPDAFVNGHTAPSLTDVNGFAHTGFRCRSERPGYLLVDGEPGGVITIGGLRYGLHDLQARVAKCVPDAHVEVVADPVLGERIRVEAVDPAAAVAALRSAGHAEQLIEAVAPATKRRAIG
jgi:AMP-binding enzyme